MLSQTSDFLSCLEKQKKVEDLFINCHDLESKYQKIMELGKKQSKLPSSLKIEENLVRGCQSLMYLNSSLVDEKMRFQAESEALISAGLAALLVMVYDGEAPEVVLKCPPTYLDNLKIPSSLSPSRANGLYSLHLRMKQEALHSLSLQ
jgi:cysteine desulfuration protein SufE